MQHMLHGDADFQAALLNRDRSREAAESIPATQRATPSPDAAAWNSIFHLSETEGSLGTDEAPGPSRSFPPGSIPHRDTTRLQQHIADASVKAEAQARSRNTAQSDLPLVNEPPFTLPSHGLEAIQDNVLLHQRRIQRSCRAAGVKRARVGSANGRAPGGAPSSGQELESAARHPHAAIAPSAGEAKETARLASVFTGSTSSWMMKAGGCPPGNAAARSRNAHPKEQPSCPGSQLSPPSTGVTSSQMVKSVSPAGVVRIGGRNRRKRTKYDLAYKQMEELGPFEEEAKSVDLSKVSGSSFALELLRNPQQYSYESWAYGFAWPVGADGRRLLLRKLRGVYWSNPEKWQRVLQENNLYRRDLFTLATVQELFKVTHLMGADVWDFLLKCTALTQKCDALSNKDVEVGDDEEPGVSSPPGAPQRTPQPSGIEACKSEDDLRAPSNKFFGNGLPCPGFLRKRIACGGRDEKEMSKRSRGRPRKSLFKVQGRISGLEGHAASSAPEKVRTGPPVPGSDATARWLNAVEISQAQNTPHSSLRSALGEALEGRLLHMEEQCPRDRHTELPDTTLSETQHLVAAMLRSGVPLSIKERCCRGVPPTKSSTSGADHRVLGSGRSTNVLLKLTAHYTFMAQFMQCCMLVEVQRTLLRLAEEFKPLWAPDRNIHDGSVKEGANNTDPTARACFESLMHSSNVHMQFVQIIVQNLHRQAEHGNASAPLGGQHAPCRLSEQLHSIMRQFQLHRHKDHFPLTTPESQRPEGISDELLQAFRDLSQLQLELNSVSAGQRAAEIPGDDGTQRLDNLHNCELINDVPTVPHNEASLEGRPDGLTSSQASSPE